MASSLLSSQTLLLLNPNPNKSSFFRSLGLHLPNSRASPSFKTLSFPLRSTPKRLSATNPKPSLTVSASSSMTQSPITGSTRTVTTILAIALSLIRKFHLSIFHSLPQHVGPALGSTVGPLFFAALKDRPSGYLNTPLTVVAAGLSKWLDIYSGVLMVRVLLSWFPNIPWERQPLSAIRDLCDPYLNLFRNIIPPIFDTLDVSPLLAFGVLGTLGSILYSSRGAY